MNTYSITLAALVLVACAEAPMVQPMEDTGVVDAGEMETDAGQTEETDAGAGDSSTTDAGAPDGGDLPSDAGTGTPDSGSAPDAGGSDASMDGSTPDASTPDAMTPDAGPVAPPSAPVGAAVDVTALNCAVDSAGHFWCWQRWDSGPLPRTTSEVRYLGSEFVSAGGTCARRADGTTWCADFTAMTMVEVIDGSATLVLDSVSELSDLAHGCGLRSGHAYCWVDGGGVEEVLPRTPEGLRALTGLPATAVAPVPQSMPVDVRRPAYALAVSAPNDELTDTCYSVPGSPTRCITTSTWYDVARPDGGTDHVLGNSWDCSRDTSHRTVCWTSTSHGYRTPGTTASAFYDHAAGRVRTAAGLSDVPGLCVSTVDAGTPTIKCYSTSSSSTEFRLSYTVAW